MTIVPSTRTQPMLGNPVGDQIDLALFIRSAKVNCTERIRIVEHITLNTLLIGT